MFQNDISIRIRRRLPDFIAFACAVFMLCYIPLAFHDAFFDINRHKVNMVIRWIPGFCILMLVSLLFDPERKTRFSGNEGRISSISMLLLMAFCVVSCARAGFTKAVLTGSEGRYCGLYFMLSCGAAYFVISSGRMYLKRLLPLVIVCAAVCAGLGFANAIGFDPLGFYDRIKKGQEPTFLSTIGNFDFFGTFIVMMLSLAGAQFVLNENRAMRWFGGIGASIMALGATACRTECAFAGMHMACFMLFALSGDDYARMARACVLWAISFISLPITYPLLEASVYQPHIDGLPKTLYKLHIGEYAALILVVLAIVFLVMKYRRIKPLGRKWLLKRMMVLCACGAVLLFAAMVYFSVFDTKTKLGSLANFLRFNDSWGTLRGFVYVRSLRAFRDFSPMDKLFGAGMELTRSILTPYFDDPKMLRYGIFNDPHCQPLQMLLTCGIFGMICFLALYLSVLLMLFKHADDDPIACGLLCSVWCYGLILLINVTQPILISTYYSICALSVACVRKNRNRRREL